MLSLLPLLFLVLRSVTATEDFIEGKDFEKALEDLASESLGVEEIQVCKGFVEPEPAKQDIPRGM